MGRLRSIGVQGWPAAVIAATVGIVVVGSGSAVGNAAIAAAPSGSAATPSGSAASPSGSAASTAAGSYVALAPKRLLDTRVGGRPVAARGVISLPVLGKGGIAASGVSAVVVNLTVTAATSTGYLVVYPSGGMRPVASSTNFQPGRTVAHSVVVKVGANGAVDLYNGSAGTVQAVVDVQGYYASGSAAAPGAFTPVAPSRVLDTRNGTGALLDPVHANASVSFAVAGQAGVPTSGVSAVVLNVTATASATHGYVEPAGGFYAPYATSILNYAPGRTVSNLFLAPVGTDGRASLQSISPGTTALIADVAGYFTAGTPKQQGMFGAIKPTRLVDTRSTHALAANATLAVAVTGLRGVPSNGVTAVVMNLTAVSPGSHGFLTAYPSATSVPATSSLNYLSGQLASNLIITAVGADGKVDVHNTSSAATDVLVDVTGYVGPIAGSSWSGRTSVDPASGGFASISCPTATFCAAVDASGHALLFDGTSWSAPQAVSAPNDALTSVSCTSAQFCVATSLESAYRFDGHYWGDPTALVPLDGDGDAPPPAGPVSCVVTSFCMALSSPTDVAIFNGSDWVQHKSIGSGLSSVSCPSTTFCVLGEPGGVVTYRAGVWSHTTLTGGPVNAGETVSCASTSFCVALNSANQAATFDGTSWTPDAATGQTTGTPVSLSCESTTFCVAGDTAGGLSVYDGSTWGTRHGGDPAAPAYVSCASGAFCGAVFGDPAGSVASYRGGTWTTAVGLNPTATTPQSVSCPTSTFCAAVDSSGAASVMTGTSWSPRKIVNDQVDGATASVSCVSSTFCLALFEDRHYSEYNGSTWSAPASAPVSGAVSCSSPTFCAAAGRVSAATFNGTSWSGATDLDSNGTLSSVSCVSSTFCVASAIDGNVWRYQGGAWSTAHRVADQLDGVSCTSASFCVAVDNGLAYNFDGSTWTATTTAAQGYAFQHVSCASSTFCVAGDLNGTVQTWNGTSWSGLIAADPGHGIASVSCPTAAFCAVLDFDGAVVRGT